METSRKTTRSQLCLSLRPPTKTMVMMKRTTMTTVLMMIMMMMSMSTVEGFPGGAPNYVCNSMRPGHPFSAQVYDPRTFPYSVQLSSPRALPGDVVTVTVSGYELNGFVSTVHDRALNFVPGFSPDDKFKILNCNAVHKTVQNSGLTHTKRLNSTSTSFRWTIPSTATLGAQYNIRLTLVHNVSTYWVATNNTLTVGQPLTTNTPLTTTTTNGGRPRPATTGTGGSSASSSSSSSSQPATSGMTSSQRPSSSKPGSNSGGSSGARPSGGVSQAGGSGSSPGNNGGDVKTVSTTPRQDPSLSNLVDGGRGRGGSMPVFRSMSRNSIGGGGRGGGGGGGGSGAERVGSANNAAKAGRAGAAGLGERRFGGTGSGGRAGRVQVTATATPAAPIGRMAAWMTGWFGR